MYITILQSLFITIIICQYKINTKVWYMYYMCLESVKSIKHHTHFISIQINQLISTKEILMINHMNWLMNRYLDACCELTGVYLNLASKLTLKSRLWMHHRITTLIICLNLTSLFALCVILFCNLKNLCFSDEWFIHNRLFNVKCVRFSR
jgi:hypothetical protein